VQRVREQGSTSPLKDRIWVDFQNPLTFGVSPN
jgi:hypothetical protein